VTKEFISTTALTLGVLVSVTALGACQWLQKKRRYEEQKE